MITVDEVISSVQAILRFALGLGFSIVFVLCFIAAAWYETRFAFIKIPFLGS